MTGEGHLIFSVACAIFAKKAALTPQLAQGDWWHIIPASLSTCLLPDIDHPHSLLGQRLRWISRPIARAFGHRGFTHSLLAIIFGIILFEVHFADHGIFATDVLQGMVIGYLSHLLADMLTPSGIPLFWPYRQRFRIPLINKKKSQKSERIFCIVLVLITLYWQTDLATSVQLHIKKLKIFGDF